MNLKLQPTDLGADALLFQLASLTHGWSGLIELAVKDLCTQIAPILQSKLGVNYAIIKTVHPPSYHHNDFSVTKATLWQTYLVCFMQVHRYKCINKYIYIYKQYISNILYAI